MVNKASSIVDDSPLTKFHIKLTIFSSGGPFLDGYILSIVGMALLSLNKSFEINSLWNGLLGSSALIGVFIGGLLFGYLTDRVGRESMYRLDLYAFLILSILQIFATNVEQLFVLRLLLGIAIGADYPIATSLLTEFSPRKYRGKLLGFLIVSWYLGATIAYFVGYFLLDSGPDAWKWMLASSAIPSLIVIFLRSKTPESPRWLLSKGKNEEALKIMKSIYGESVTLADIPTSSVQKPSLLKLFSPAYRKRTLFVMLFWNFQLIPMFAIYTFAPTLLETFKLDNGNLSHIGSALISLLFLIGCTVATFFIDRIGRRALLIYGFLFTTIALLVLGLAPGASSWIIISMFFMYAFFAGAPAILEWAYPNELFPTDIRGTAVGFSTTVSRIGATVGTFGLPIALANYGVGTTMLITAGLNLIGLLVAIFMAPETKNLSLETASQEEEARDLDSQGSVTIY
ncbi:MFS transporter [Bacillus salipaludis]|uniref:MFS transporter n=1 Tax=Bacillus salipaludis TaxID=2547811 RepID=A0A4R5VL43_9BACI|nr:MFS transporter [Bacillus salipaludis]MDQ6599091.1 MFS transporter [Bacillus salipaludis]TDK58743.1 MFS transporter [Bacillus salipaludis]